MANQARFDEAFADFASDIMNSSQMEASVQVVLDDLNAGFEECRVT
jgi:hypothetical protein